jgi:PAS domain S-box-containing protein
MSNNLVTMQPIRDKADVDIIEDLPIAYIEMDIDGVITRANRLSNALHPSHSGQLLGKRVWELMPIAEQKPSRASFAQAMQSTQPLPVARRFIYTNAEEFRTYEVHRSVIRDADGTPQGMRVVSVDVTDSHAAQQEAERERAWLESVLVSLPEAIVVTDALGFIRSTNQTAEALFGWKPGQMLGEAIEEAMPLVSYVSENAAEFSHKLVLDRPSKGVACFLDSQRRPVRVEISTAPILEKESGFTSGVVALMRKVEQAS